MSTYLLLPHDDGRKGHPIFFERKLLPGSGGTHDGDGGPFVQYVTGWSEPPVFVVKAAPLSFDIGPVAADVPVVRISAAQLREAMEGKPLPPGAGATGELQDLLAYLDLSPPEIFMHLR